MDGFIRRLQQYDDYMCLGGASVDSIENAENTLGVNFSIEYKEYLKACGMATANGHEFSGIGKSKRLSVVEMTTALRKKITIPNEMYVIEKLGIDGIVVTQDVNGSVYQVYTNGSYTKIAESMLEYLLQSRVL